MTTFRRCDGFTLVELLVASGLATAVAAGAFTVLASVHGAFLAQPEAADVQQRLRVAVDTLTRNLLMADLVLPYRVGIVDSDAAAGRYYRPDAISILSAPAPNVEQRLIDCYYLHADARTGTFQLRHYDGGLADFPVVDQIVALTFDYFSEPGGTAAAPIDPATLVDGPWHPDAADPNRVDADLLTVRRVRVRLRAQAARAFRGPAGPLFALAGSAATPGRYVPDQEVQFDVALRNRRLE